MQRVDKIKWQEEDGERYCKDCGSLKPYSQYYLRSNGRPLGRVCRDCTLEKNRTSSMNEEVREKRLIRQKLYSENNAEKVKASSYKHYNSLHGRAASMLKTSKRKSSKFDNSVHDLTLEFIMQKLARGVCEVTGLSFDFDRHEYYKCNPFSPSIDRIDSTIGYKQDNVRIVIWQYNLMKGEMTDDEVYLICEEVIRAREEVLSGGLDMG